MTDIISNNLSNNYCKGCGTQFPKDSIKKLNKNKKSIICEFCGAKTKYSHIQELAIQKKPKNIHVIKDNYFFHRDSEFSENSRYWLIIFICRIIYIKISHQDAIHKNAREKDIDNIAKDFKNNIINKKRILKTEWLEELDIISKNDFIKNYRNLQTRLSSDQIYCERFLEYIRQLVWGMFGFISENFDNSEHSEFQKVILNNLKNLNLDSVNHGQNSNVQEIEKHPKIEIDNDETIQDLRYKICNFIFSEMNKKRNRKITVKLIKKAFKFHPVLKILDKIGVDNFLEKETKKYLIAVPLIMEPYYSKDKNTKALTIEEIQNKSGLSKKQIEMISKNFEKTFGKNVYNHSKRFPVKSKQIDSSEELSQKSKIKEFKNIESELNQENVKKSEDQMVNLTEDNFIDFYKVIVELIKREIGVEDDQYDKYIKHMDKCGIDKKSVFKRVNSEDTLNELLKIVKIKEDKKNRNQAKRILLVIALALLKCPDYKCMKENLMHLAGFKSLVTARENLKKYIPYLKTLNPNLNVKKWLPKPYETLSYHKIKESVEKLGFEKTEKKGILLKPENNSDFLLMKKKTRAKKGDLYKIPIRVKCGKCGHEWNTNFHNIYREKFCNICSHGEYTFDKIKALIKEAGLNRTGFEGVLITPRTKSEFEILKKKSKLKPSRIPLAIKCGNCGNIWETNVSSIKYSQFYDYSWCTTCSDRGVYTYKRIKQLIEKVGIERTGEKGILLEPKNQKEFEKDLNNLKKQVAKELAIPSRVSLLIKCRKCNSEWKTNAFNLSQSKWCKYCSQGVYSFNKIKELVEDIGLRKTGKKAKLLEPLNEKEFEKMLKNFREKGNKRTVPSLLSIKVRCGNCRLQFSTKPEYLAQNKWCPNCAEGEYEQIVRWYLIKIFKFVFNLDLSFSKTMLYKIIKVYNNNNYSTKERKIIKNLITPGSGRGHLDGYEEIKINGKRYKIAFEYNGPQHKIFPNHVHKSRAQFYYYRQVDLVKRKLCRENNIIVLEFDYDVDKEMIHPKTIQNHIINDLTNKTIIKLCSFDIPQFSHLNPEFGQFRLTHYL